MKYTALHSADSQFPDVLKQIENTPARLLVRGDLNFGRPLVAVVGSRKPTAYGLQATNQIVRELVMAGVGIVSGLAYGIDKQAHIAALDAGGYTIAVLGNSIDRIAPSQHKGLADRILEQGGAIASEYPPGTTTQPFMFIDRNRIIAGLSRGVIVIQAGSRSGSLSTAKRALDAGRSVMALPGDITSEMSLGTNRLIREGAVLIRSSVDVLDELGVAPPKKRPTRSTRSSLGGDTQEEATLLKLISHGVYDSQELIEQSGLAAAEFAQIITLMEISGKVRDGGSGTWTLR